jgi:hypothetical protein
MQSKLGEPVSSKGVYPWIVPDVCPITTGAATHLISPEALRGNNFEEFFEARRKALLDLISTAMGKAPAVSAEPTEPTGDPIDDEDDTNDEIDVDEAA